MVTETRSPYGYVNPEQARQSAEHIGEMFQRFQGPISEITKLTAQLAGEIGLPPASAAQLAASVASNVSQVVSGSLSSISRDGRVQPTTWVSFRTETLANSLSRSTSNGSSRRNRGSSRNGGSTNRQIREAVLNALAGQNN